MDIEDTASQTGTHLTSVVAIHAKRAALAESLVPVGELAEAAGSEDGWISGLEVPIDDQTTVVDKSIVVDAPEDIRIDIAVATGH